MMDVQDQPSGDIQEEQHLHTQKVEPEQAGVGVGDIPAHGAERSPRSRSHQAVVAPKGAREAPKLRTSTAEAPDASPAAAGSHQFQRVSRVQAPTKWDQQRRRSISELRKEVEAKHATQSRQPSLF